MPLTPGAGSESHSGEGDARRVTVSDPESYGRGDRSLLRPGRLLFVCFTFALGLFLLIYPWMDTWALNHFPEQLQNFAQNLPFHNLEDFWDDPNFRGAVSGLGLVNVWIALQEIVRLARGK